MLRALPLGSIFLGVQVLLLLGKHCQGSPNPPLKSLTRVAGTGRDWSWGQFHGLAHLRQMAP